MKLCTQAIVEDGEVTDIVDISLVADDHQFGLSEDGALLHIEGSILSATPAR